ncbi:hypothetical protein GCM10011512_13230 [Tersicoccus solisilvae]|uniref:DUF4166 domain-containing protein n=1 Tax=Tersicoccus solisilvae TaxID=1882339 RepID=A0ABQ1NZ06_9MICC|nr:DUF4166 domain-containing protein [Tersicoccus solisilvae]GGC87631.1 hypothetical protein GCM10011512_13230 [Tersicoccus solisilvae]
MSGSLYERVLGARYADLHPRVRDYFAQPAGTSVRFDGVFDVAGCTVPPLRPVFAALAGEEMFFPEYGQGVPFSVVNRSSVDETGAPCLAAERILRFGNRTRRFTDLCRLGADGLLLDLVGRHRVLRTGLRLSVTAAGAMRLASTTAWVGPPDSLAAGGPSSTHAPRAVPGLRVPRVLAAGAYTEQGFDDVTGRFTIQTRVVQPLLGTVFVYAGSFDPEPLPAT